MFVRMQCEKVTEILLGKRFCWSQLLNAYSMPGRFCKFVGQSHKRTLKGIMCMVTAREYYLRSKFFSAKYVVLSEWLFP